MDLASDPDALQAMLQGLAACQSAVCLCDPQDRVRYANPLFRATFFLPDLPPDPFDFVDAIMTAITAGHGIRLESTPPDIFAAKVRERRMSGPARFTFSADLRDGSWWLVNDYRLADGWILVVASDISALKDEEFKLRRAHEAAVRTAETDALTGVSNRRQGMREAQSALAAFQSNRVPLTVAVLDIDHFKAVNDRYGHGAGDEVLVAFASALTHRLGMTDHVSRFGGEEFMVVMPNTTASRGAARLERLMRSIRQANAKDGAPSVPYSFSAGLAAAQAGDDLKSLLGRADAALYVAKGNGRNQLHVDRTRASSAA